MELIFAFLSQEFIFLFGFQRSIFPVIFDTTYNFHIYHIISNFLLHLTYSFYII